MDELKIKKLTEPVTFTIRVDKSIVDFMMTWHGGRTAPETSSSGLRWISQKIKSLSSLDCLCTAVSVTCAKTTTCFRRTLPPI